nr:hypothetical protein [uncultured Desulfobacter sp.]
MLTMKTQGIKMAKIVLLLFCILLCNSITIEKAFSRESDLKISVDEDGRIDIVAAHVKFNDLIEAISLKTGIVFNTETELTNYIDCDFEKKEIETAIRDLIRKTGYDSAIFYSKNIEGNFIVTKVQIGVDNEKSVSRKNTSSVKASHENIKVRSDEFTQNQYKAQFKDTEKLLKQIHVSPVDGALVGIRLEKIERPSVFDDLGLSQGDVITNINDHPVQTKDDLIKFLNPKQLPSWIRIERKNANQLIDPIYIRLTGI